MQLTTIPLEPNSLAPSAGAGNTTPMANPQKVRTDLEAGLYYAPVTLISEIFRGVAEFLGSGFPTLNDTPQECL